MKLIQMFLKSTSLVLTGMLLMADATAQGSFLSAIDDLPLMEGLNEAEGETMVFDSSSGRIVEALGIGMVTRQQVIQFYSETLPQLGWLEISPGHFVREYEALKIEFPTAPVGRTLNVLFMLSPAQ
jgi:hypothetical protein